MSIVKQYLSDLDKVFVAPERLTQFAYTPPQLDELYDRLPDLVTAIEIKDQHCILVPGPKEGMNLLDVWNFFPGYFNPSECAWCRSVFQTALTDEYILPGKWLAIRRTPFPASINLPWSAQLEALPSGMYVPRAVELAYALAVYYKVYEKFLFPAWMNRSSTITADLKQVSVGLFKPNGMSIQAVERSKKKTNLMLGLGLRLEHM